MTSARVLVVEDNPRIGEKLREVLSRNGFAATLARDGAHGLDVFSADRFDVVLVEHLVPGVEGGRFVDHLRRVDDEVPVVVMASSPRAQTRLNQQGPAFIQGFLLKPFRVPDLLRALGAALVARDAGPTPSVEGRRLLSGTLSDGTLAEIIVRLLRQAAVGVLRVQKDGARRDVYFLNGLPVFAESNLLTETFGRWLLARGVISPEQYAAVRAYGAKHGVRQGEALVGLEILNNQEVYALLRGQVIERVARCFTWVGATYEFTEDARFLEDKLTFPMNPMALLVEGALRRSTPVALQARLESQRASTLAPSAVLDELAPFIDRLNRDPPVSLVLKRSATVGAFADALPLVGPRIAALLEVLEACGAVSRDDGPLPDVATFSGEVEVEAEYVLESPDQLDPEHSPALDTVAERVIARYLATRGGDHFAVLGVPRDAAPEAVEAAWLDVSREFHPDRFTEHPDPDVRLRAKEVFIKAGQAFGVLADPHTAQVYRERLDEARTQPNARWAAEEELARGEACLARGDHLAARLAFARAHAVDPDEPMYQALLGWATWLDAADDDDRAEGQDLLEGALDRDPCLTLAWELLARVHVGAARHGPAADCRARADALRSGLLGRLRTEVST
jgi:CheY-like chemotaxis protein